MEFLQQKYPLPKEEQKIAPDELIQKDKEFLCLSLQATKLFFSKNCVTCHLNLLKNELILICMIQVYVIAPDKSLLRSYSSQLAA